jgi:Rap1a immunity proteins
MGCPTKSVLEGIRSDGRPVSRTKSRLNWSVAIIGGVARPWLYCGGYFLPDHCELDALTEWMMTKFVVAILLALTMPANAEENLASANSYLPGCRYFVVDNWAGGVREAYQRGQCSGFIAGLIYEAAGTSLCMPSGVTYEQGVRIVIAYIEARPQRMHESFGLLALEALTAAWPCKR